MLDYIVMQMRKVFREVHEKGYRHEIEIFPNITNKKENLHLVSSADDTDLVLPYISAILLKF